MGAGSDIALLDDHLLADRAHRGDRAAFDELARRHLVVAWGLAGAVTRHRGLAVDAVVAGVAGALADPHGLPQIGEGSALIPLLRATRRAAIDGPTDPTRELSAVMIDDPEPEAHAALVSEAFHLLPERSRSALWLVEVERLDAPVAAGALEVQAGELPALVERARLGLGEQLLKGGLGTAVGSECARTVDRLSDYMTDELSEREVVRTRRHLDSCERCRDRLVALDDLMPLLRQCAVPMPAPLVDDARRSWAASIVPASGPLRLHLPGGRPMPVWAERALAGTAAAVVMLGITGALIASGGRGSKVRDDLAARTATAQEPLTGSGESALADPPALSELDLESGTAIPVPGSGATSTSSGTGAGTGSRLFGDTARSSATAAGLPGSVPISPARPPSTSTSATTPPPAPSAPVAPVEEPPPPPPPSEPMLQIDLGVGPLLGLSLGDECTGLTVLGATLGCDGTSGEALDLGLGGSLLGPLALGG